MIVYDMSIPLNTVFVSKLCIGFSLAAHSTILLQGLLYFGSFE